MDDVISRLDSWRFDRTNSSAIAILKYIRHPDFHKPIGGSPEQRQSRLGDFTPVDVQDILWVAAYVAITWSFGGRKCAVLIVGRRMR
jgi:hypothetical protein